MGRLHPLEGNACISAFLIDDGNIVDVWDDAMAKLVLLSRENLNPLRDA